MSSPEPGQTIQFIAEMDIEQAGPGGKSVTKTIPEGAVGEVRGKRWITNPKTRAEDEIVALAMDDEEEFPNLIWVPSHLVKRVRRAPMPVVE